MPRKIVTTQKERGLSLRNLINLYSISKYDFFLNHPLLSKHNDIKKSLLDLV